MFIGYAIYTDDCGDDQGVPLAAGADKGDVISKTIMRISELGTLSALDLIDIQERDISQDEALALNESVQRFIISNG